MHRRRTRRDDDAIRVCAGARESGSVRLIAGIIQLDGASASGDTLDAMLAALTAPGLEPQRARWVEGPAALGVLDFSGDVLPTELPRGEDGILLAADIRLDESDGVNEEQSALAAFAKWERDLPDKLHGDFALAAWNPRTRHLTLARDIVGVRPLCYSYQPGRCFAFASLPSGLYRSDVVAPSLDAIAVACVYVQRYLRSSATGFRNISWLLPAHSLVLTPSGLELYRAWRPDPAHVGSFKGSSQEAAAILRSLVEKAVECRTRGAGPVATHLSGGLDSSAVTVVAARQLRTQGRTLYAYSMLAQPAPGLVVRDESEYVDAVLAQEPGVVGTPIHMSPPGAAPAFDPSLPLGVPPGSPNDRACADAARVGVHVLLSGAGGDEAATYNGINIYGSLLLQGKWVFLFRELRARARVDGRPLLRVAFNRLIFPFLPQFLTSPRRKRLNQVTAEERRRIVSSFLEPDVAEQVLETLPADPEWTNRPQDRIEMPADGFLTGPNNVWSAVAARHGIAVSYPLLDRRILDFCLTLPIERFLEDGFSRQPFRRAMAGILPESIRWRTSKFSVFPDAPANLIAALPELLIRAEKLRADTTTVRLFNPDAIIAALREASQHQGEVEAPPELGQARPPRWLRMAALAHRALVLAEHIRSFPGTGLHSESLAGGEVRRADQDAYAVRTLEGAADSSC